MVKSKKYTIRLKPEYEIKLQSLMKLWTETNISEGVRRCIDRAVDTEHERQEEARELRERMVRKGIKPEELGIKAKRDYLGR